VVTPIGRPYSRDAFTMLGSTSEGNRPPAASAISRLQENGLDPSLL